MPRSLLLVFLFVFLTRTATGDDFWQSPHNTLLGVWEGEPLVAPQGPDESGVDAPSRRVARALAGSLRLRLYFRDRKTVIMTLRRKGKAEDTKTGRWSLRQTVDGVWQLAITVAGEGRPDESVTRRLDLELNGKDQFVAREVGGDFRVPPMKFTRGTLATQSPAGGQEQPSS